MNEYGSVWVQEFWTNKISIKQEGELIFKIHETSHGNGGTI